MLRMSKLALLGAVAALILPAQAQTVKPLPAAAKPAGSATKAVTPRVQAAKPAVSTTHRQTGARRGARRAPKPAPVPVPVPQLPPPPTPTPEQMPPTPPHVTYETGQLPIVAHNPTLADVLSAVRARTGAGIETPPG